MIDLWDSGTFWVVTVVLYIVMVIILLIPTSRTQPISESAAIAKKTVWQSAITPIREHFGLLFDLIIFCVVVRGIVYVAVFLKETLSPNVGAAFFILIPDIVSGIVLRKRFLRR